jgi:hypothetical protein
MKTFKTIAGILATLMLTINVGSPSAGQSRTYYISPGGNDTNSGLSKRAAWASIERVNRAAFQPGDAILFESNGVWKGQLHPQGNGAPGRPIIIGSYGKGSRPVINMGETEGVGIYLYNQSWWEIKGLEVTSGAPFKLGIVRRGIVADVGGRDGQKIEHISIRDCSLHDIWGQVGGDKSGIAIYVGQLVLGPQKYKNCVAADVLIENNIIERLDKVAIAVNGNKGVIVRGNRMKDIGGDGIVIINAVKGLVERNIAERTCLRSGDPDLDTGSEKWWPHTAAIWLWRCTETIMQFNQVYDTGRQPFNNDGQAYDFDYECRNCILQYNYSVNNHGLLLVMPRTYNNIARYNISQNDQRHLILAHGKIEDGNLIHNNVFFVDRSTVNVDYHADREKSNLDPKEIAKLGATFKNNIFYATGQGRFLRGGSVFLRNCYFGPWKNGMPDDPEKVLADPMFVLAGAGGIGISTLDGYKLQPKSPCINAGAFIEMDSKRDFFGNPITDGKIDIGVYEQPAPKR